MVTIRNIKTILTAPRGIDLVVVKVETSEPGLYGLGCATFTQRWAAVATAVEEYMKPLLVGRCVNDIEDIWQTAMGSSYWRNGPVLNNAISGVDEALWDIKGKMAGMPVYDLLGGKCREAVSVYRHTDGATPEEVEENVRRYMEDGYRYLRCQMGTYGGQMGKGKQRVISPENSKPGAYYDPNQYCAGVVKLFLEDALSPEQMGWFSHFRNQTAVPLAMGELFNNPIEWNELISKRLIDYIRVHVSQIGGLTPARKLAALCENFGVRTAWHGPGDLSPVGVVAQLHLDLAIPNFGIQEFSGFSPEEEEVFPGCPQVRNGYLYANDKPGFGIDIDEKKAAMYPCSYREPGWLLARTTDGTAVRP